MHKPFFPVLKDAPDSLRYTVSRRVRFEEVDALGIVWHGRYAGFFEEARIALGKRYGIGYLDFHAGGIHAPVKILHIDYHLPLVFDESFIIDAVLHWTEAARLNHEYILRNREGKTTTTGYTVQLMLDAKGEILVIPPPFYREFLDRWKKEKL